MINSLEGPSMPGPFQGERKGVPLPTPRSAVCRPGWAALKYLNFAGGAWGRSSRHHCSRASKHMRTHVAGFAQLLHVVLLVSSPPDVLSVVLARLQFSFKPIKIHIAGVGVRAPQQEAPLPSATC